MRIENADNIVSRNSNHIEFEQWQLFATSLLTVLQQSFDDNLSYDATHQNKIWTSNQ